MYAPLVCIINAYIVRLQTKQLTLTQNCEYITTGMYIILVNKYLNVSRNHLKNAACIK